MKIVILYGQNHKGSTYHICRMLADKLEGEITEFFLPRAFDQFCTGCTNCFQKDERACPHESRLEPIRQKIDEADLLILGSPVYVMHVTGPMKNLLDHFAYRFMVHRPEEKMFSKQAVCIATAAGAGMRNANKDMADSLFYWGIPKIYQYGVRVKAVSYERVPEKIKIQIEKKTDRLAKRIKLKQKKVKPGIRTKALFYVMKHFGGLTKVDHIYWEERDWHIGNRPWKRA